ncbi:SbmA/BacA-like family transporter [Aerosakkonemataceae cyanobacterium BLCC-F50]|uniref:SbmA/BacA-like family transporter n=1 Tax=Floridaenema flaviceps BLCC-F50 TaxID=3153642 RepID=A0ABV4XR30_9CYAN
MINKRNRGFLQRFWTIAKLYWCGNEKWGAIALLLTLIALILVSTQVKVFMNTQQGNILSALVAKDVNGFWMTTWKVFGVSLMLPTIWCAYQYIRKKLTLYWRRWLTNHFLGKYFRNRAFYELSQSQKEIDNPDQRIAEDINKFADGFLLLFFDMFNACSQIIAFSAVLWIISPTLMIFLVIYAGSSTLFTIWLFGKKLVKLNFEQLKKEADFRFGLVRLRENAESVAFYQGEAQEFNQVNHLFNQVFKNFNKLIFWQEVIVNIAGSFFYYIPGFLPAVIIAPQIFSGEL